MAIHRYISCAKCLGIGIIAIHPREEWTPDMEKHFKGKTVRVTGSIVRWDYDGYGTPSQVEIVVNDLSQLEVVK